MDILLQMITMAGGLGLFLYGMNILGTGLEKVSGGRLERTLEKMTSNIFIGVLVGAFITAAIQSSSATTVIVVGLVNAGILKLRSAAGVIMGANIGTTVTGQILRLAELDGNESVGAILNFIKPTTLAPIVTIVGILIFMVAKKKKVKVIGEVMLGFGILFNGMFIMTNAVEPLSKLPIFEQAFATLTNPILGVLAGALITAIIQSSSASVGILQALASTDAITCSAAFPIIMGQNIGTCITSLISSIGANVNARRAAMLHLYFNVVGTIIFLVGVYTFQYTIGFEFWDKPIGMGGIANFHTIFNVTVTLLLIPFSKLLEKLAVLTVRGSKTADVHTDMANEMNKLDERFLVSPSLALGQCETVVGVMGEYARSNFSKSLALFEHYDLKQAESIREVEDVIDRMEDRLNNYLLKLTDKELTEAENKNITHLLKLISEFERIGDYTINLLEGAEELYDKEVKFSSKALDDLKIIHDAVNEIVGMALTCYQTADQKVAIQIEPLEETIDMIEDALKSKHIERLKKGKCSIDAGLIFLEILTNLERISDHCSNVAVYMIGFKYDKETLNRHEYIRRIHEGRYDDYALYMEEYKKKYVEKIIKDKDKDKEKEKEKEKSADKHKGSAKSKNQKVKLLKK